MLADAPETVTTIPTNRPGHERLGTTILLDDARREPSPIEVLLTVRVKINVLEFGDAIEKGNGEPDCPASEVRTDDDDVFTRTGGKSTKV